MCTYIVIKDCTCCIVDVILLLYMIAHSEECDLLFITCFKHLITPMLHLLLCKSHISGMHCYAFLSDESLFTCIPFDVIVYLKQYNYNGSRLLL